MSNTATGPRSDAGKERSSLNAATHGLCSERPVLAGESAEEWDVFLVEIVAELLPATFTERELAERIALQMWRQRRAARYEVSAGTDAQLDRVVRYEAHVTRQLKEARKMLNELQAERRAREAMERRAAPAPAETKEQPRKETGATSSFRNFHVPPAPVAPPSRPEAVSAAPSKVTGEFVRSVPVAVVDLEVVPASQNGRT